MPNRDLKESNRRSASLQLLSDAAERLWYRLITAVDDFGRLEADPEVVFTTCFQRVPKGWTAVKVSKCLRELSTLTPEGQTPLIALYQIKSKSYLQICSACLYITRRAAKSKYPDPPPLTPQISSVADICAQVRANSSVSRIPIPDTRIPIPVSRPSVGEPTPTGQAMNLLESFTLTAEIEAWAVKEGIHNPGQYVEEFRDYWRSVGGKRKNGQLVRDWAAAFRNRLRTLKDEGKLLKKQTFNLQKWADESL